MKKLKRNTGLLLATGLLACLSLSACNNNGNKANLSPVKKPGLNR